MLNVTKGKSETHGCSRVFNVWVFKGLQRMHCLKRALFETYGSLIVDRLTTPPQADGGRHTISLSFKEIETCRG
jgi:hypothetical protein